MSPSTTITGARLQVPTQRAVSSDSFPSAVVSPRADAEAGGDPVEQSPGPGDVAGRPGADHAGVLPGRLEGEIGVEGGDPVDPAERDAEGGADVGQSVEIEVAEGFLHRVEHLDQGGRITPQAPEPGVDRPPPLVVTRRERRDRHHSPEKLDQIGRQRVRSSHPGQA
jgi:hypothetical protein